MAPLIKFVFVTLEKARLLLNYYGFTFVVFYLACYVCQYKYFDIYKFNFRPKICYLYSKLHVQREYSTHHSLNLPSPPHIAV